MAAGNDLGRLLTQLRNVSSPLERMKLIARAWRSVRRLGPRERSVLARQIGLDEAEELIESIAVSRGGLSPATVQRALDRLREVKPGRLKQTLKDLQDPERRRELLDRGLDTASGMLAGPEEAPAQESAQVVEIVEDEEEVPVPVSAEPPAKEEPPPPPPAKRDATAAPAVAAAAAVATRPSPPEKRAEPEAARLTQSAPPPPERAPEEEPVSVPPAAAPVEPVPVAEPAPLPPPEPRAVPNGSSELLRLVGGQPSLFGRLRVLRENLDLARPASPERLRALLDLFSAGWARRRVVNAMIEARVPDSVEEAVFLIEQLENQADRRWCARTLLHEWELSAGERELIASRHDRTGSSAKGA